MICFFFNDTATTEIYTLSLHDALPISLGSHTRHFHQCLARIERSVFGAVVDNVLRQLDRKSTRLNSSHANISYAVFCLKKKNNPPPLHVSSRSTSLVAFLSLRTLTLHQ